MMMNQSLRDVKLQLWLRLFRERCSYRQPKGPCPNAFFFCVPVSFFNRFYEKGAYAAACSCLEKTTFFFRALRLFVCGSLECFDLKISQLFREALLTSRPLFFFFLASVIIFNLFLSPTDHVMRPHPPCSVEQQIVNCKGAVSIIHVGIETRHACSTLSLGPQKLHLHHCFSAQQNVKWTRVFCG